MKAIQVSRGVLAAAVLGALTPLFAQSTSNSTTQEPRTSQALPSAATTMPGTNGASASGAANGTTSAAATSKPLCSSLDHPQAGKLADKGTGMAKENSASPVHMDCTPDSEAAASGAITGGTTANTMSPNTMNPTIDPTATTDSTAAGTNGSTQAKKKTTSSTTAK